jgi:hypothetical protein
MILHNIVYASGVLFYSRSIDNTVYFLLGKDFENKWTDFGGGSEVSDKFDTEITAARETWEETLGSVSDYETLKNSLKNCNCIVSLTPSGKPYYMYIVRIPFTQTYKDKFTSTKKFISRINIDRKFLEINDIKWVSTDTIKYSIDNKKQIIRLRSIFEKTIKKEYDNILSIINS